MLLLNLNNIKSDIKNNDVLEIRGGPINCEKNVLNLYRDWFRNFSKNLKCMISREPVITEEDIGMLNIPGLYKPTIFRAFCPTKILLKKDRSGFPYKPFP